VVTIHFDDEGKGIPEDNLQKIWDPFFTTKEKGSGLGLGIVKNIIEAHNGSIQIFNREVRGARVTVELPVN
jgi:signal transduction histidine kinase